MKKNNKGFTLAELLIVVAIIAVLVAIAIPVFTSRLEQSRETTDIANLRSAYAAGQVAALAGIDGTPVTSGSKWFDPDDGNGLGSAKVALGQGTATNGKVKEGANLPAAISYNGSSDVRGQGIKVTFDSTGLTGVEFAS